MHNEQAVRPIAAAAIVVAAGSGDRMGDGGSPKQFRLLGGKPMVRWSVDALLQCEEIDRIVVVAPVDSLARMEEILPVDGRLAVAAGGATRTESVRAGMQALAGKPPEAVLVHDAARPGVTPGMVRELLAALYRAEAAAPALPVSDALKAREGEGLRTVDRTGLQRVQTPQAFRWEVLQGALAKAMGPAVDDLALVEAMGVRVVLTAGADRLMKVTHTEDLQVAERLIAGPATMRVGTGFDVHGFEPGDGVTICGVKIPHTRKLEGHSDADVGWHALTDAILGAAALGDIGDHFPPSDPQWKGAASILFLQHAVKLAAGRGLRIVNADITILAEKPRIGPHREAMRKATAEALGVALDSVSVKATTTEKLGFVGREEGIAAQAAVMLAG